MHMPFADRLRIAERWSEKNGKRWLGEHQKNERGEVIFVGMNRADRREVARSSRRKGRS